MLKLDTNYTTEVIQYFNNNNHSIYRIKEEEMKIQSWNVIKESLAKTIESNKDRLNVFG